MAGRSGDPALDLLREHAAIAEQEMARIDVEMKDTLRELDGLRDKGQRLANLYRERQGELRALTRAIQELESADFRPRF